MIGEKLRDRRLELKLTLEEVGNRVGVGKSTVRKWEKGMIANMGRDKIVSLSKVLKLDPYEILGIEEDNDISHLYSQLNSVNKERLYEYGEGLLDEQYDLQFVTKNVLEYSTNEDTDSEYVDVLLSGTVAAGTGNYNYGDTETVSIPRSELPKSDYDVMVKVTGNSMEPAFLDGDYIFIKKVDEFPNGKFAVVIVNNESFLKKVYKEDNRLRLVSLNHDYKDMYFNEYDDIKIVGTVVM